MSPPGGCPWRRAGAQCPATLSHVVGGASEVGELGSAGTNNPQISISVAPHNKSWVFFFSLTPLCQSSAPQSHSGLQAGRGSPAGSSPGGFLHHQDIGRHNREVAIQARGYPGHFKSQPVGQRQSKGAGAGDTDGSFGMTILDASSDENPSRGAPDLVASGTPA